MRFALKLQLVILATVAASSRPFGNLGSNEQNPTFGAGNQAYQWHQVQPADPNVDPKDRPGIISGIHASQT
jgi:hypothetical protein